MSRSKGSKRRLLLIGQMFQSGEPLNSTEIVRRLKQEHGLEIERKALYDDIAELGMFLPIDYIPGKRSYQLIEDPRKKQSVKVELTEQEYELLSLFKQLPQDEKEIILEDLRAG